MPTYQGGEEFEIRIRALPDDVPVFVRLRKLLKAALRAYGFRCESARDVTPKLPDPPPPRGAAFDRLPLRLERPPRWAR